MGTGWRSISITRSGHGSPGTRPQVYDLRHGWNPVGAREKHNVPTLIRDLERILEAIDRHYGNKPKIGVFHSASALVSLFLSAESHSLAAQVLFDPPLCKPGVSHLEFDDAAERAATLTRRRADRFQTQEDFIELLRYVPTFTRVVPGVLELMARTTLRRSANGQDYELRCPREYEPVMDSSGGFTVVGLERFPARTKFRSRPTLPLLPARSTNRMSYRRYFCPRRTAYLFTPKPETPGMESVGRGAAGSLLEQKVCLEIPLFVAALSLFNGARTR